MAIPPPPDNLPPPPATPPPPPDVPPPPPGMPPGPPPGPPYQPPPGYPQPYPMVPGGMPGPEAPGATASMVCGIVSLAMVPVGCFCGFLELVAVPLGIVAIVLGFRARARIAQAQGMLGGSGKALAGIILGFGAIGLGILVGVLFLIIGVTFSHLQNAFPTPTP